MSMINISSTDGKAILWSGLVGIIGEIGEPIQAAILLRTVQMWYSEDWIVEEKAIFVHPDYRKAGAKHRSKSSRGHAHALCDFSKRVANELGLPLIIGVLSNHRTAAKVRLYERQFGEPAGAFFLYNAKTGHEVVEH